MDLSILLREKKTYTIKKLISIRKRFLDSLLIYTWIYAILTPIFFLIWQSNCPPRLKRRFTQLFTWISLSQTTSSFFLNWYLQNYKKEIGDLNRYTPASGNLNYQGFQDFFTRKLKDPLNIKTSYYIWPCSGLICEYGQIAKLPLVTVKRQKRHIRTIFGSQGNLIPDHYYFYNIFLHNSDYHRIHAPTSGTIISVEHIPGDIMILRPWLYPISPSSPSFVNERVIVLLKTFNSDELIFMAIVGGPGASTIVLEDYLKIGNTIKISHEMAHFEVGSTVCIAFPLPAEKIALNKKVSTGDSYAS